ncbi:GrpE, mitochondrial [Taxawa tesnikishii (nom. ined.)]|nr:GrpE, mitochondrial [Dothideales sp. JES 119]
MFQRQMIRASRALNAQAFESRLPQSFRSSISASQPSQPSRRSGVAASRWYSEEAKKEEKAAENAQEQKETAEDPVKKELEAKKKEVVDLTDKWKRSIAEYRNLQEQTKREVQAARDFGLQRFAKDLVDSIDNLDRALQNVPQDKLAGNPELKNLYDGLKMTDTILMNTVKKHGLERFDPSETSDKFDPNKHEATFMTPQPDKEDNTVFYCQQKGFALNGRILRAAKVGVVKNS